MKKLSFLMLGLAGILTLSAATLSQFKPLDKSSQTKTVYSQAFEAAKPPKGFHIPQGFEWKRGYGENGNGGLIFRRPAKTPRYHFIRIPMPQLKEGKRYRLEYMVSAADVKGVNGPVNGKINLIGFDFKNAKNGIYLSSNYAVTKMKNGNLPWTSFKHEFALPKGAQATLCLFVRNKYTCKEVHWDNIRISELGEEPPTIYPLSPLQLALYDNCTLKMRAVSYNPNPNQDLMLFAVLPDGTELVSGVRHGAAAFSIDKLSGQGGDIKFYLCDNLTQKVLGEAVYPFTFNPKTPENYVKSDASGRLFVNGKPFFPVGMFIENPSMPQEKINRMKRMGVNTILPYHNFEMRLPEPRGKSSLKQLRQSLDILQKNDIKLCFCLTELTGRLGNVQSFDGVKGREEILKYTVNGLKDHPAMLGWYVSDENQVSELGPVKKMRFTISQNDPFHPVLTLTNIPENFVAFGPTGDIMMFDKYPIRDESTQDMQKIRDGFAQERNECQLGLWWVPQIFNWAIYPGVFPQTYQQMRWPTEEEMRSQTLLALNYHARGIIFYAYESVKKHDKYAPGDSEKLWPIVERTVRLTADLEPWFLADKEPWILKVDNKGESKVEAKIHLSNDGRKLVVITAMGPGKSDAIINLSSNKGTNYKSRFGKTKNLGGGKYHFTGNNISSDILE